MNRLEYRLASTLLRLVRLVAGAAPDGTPTGSSSPRPASRPSTATCSTSIGRCARATPSSTSSSCSSRTATAWRASSPTSSGSIRGMYHLQTAGLFVVDNAYLPIHVAPHRPTTTVVQVWHAAGRAQALRARHARRRSPSPSGPSSIATTTRSSSVASGRAAPYAAALRTPIERVLALGSPRTDFFFDEAALAAARARVLAAHPALAGRRVVLYAPTFRGRGIGKRAAPGLDAERLRAALPAGPRARPQDASQSRSGRDTDGRLRRRGRPGRPRSTSCWRSTDILITDYSSSVVEFATPPPADRPARRRPGRVRGRSRSLPRLPDRDDRDAGDRHRRRDRRDRERIGST